MSMKIDEAMTLEKLTPEEKKKRLFLSKRKHWICSVSVTQSIRRSMIKASENCETRWECMM